VKVKGFCRKTGLGLPQKELLMNWQYSGERRKSSLAMIRP